MLRSIKSMSGLQESHIVSFEKNTVSRTCELLIKIQSETTRIRLIGKPCGYVTHEDREK